MSGAGFILAINMAVAGLLAAAFLMVAVYDRKHAAARWLAFGYLLGMNYIAIEFVIPILGHPRLTVVAAFAVLLAAMVAFMAGIARKYGSPPPWPLMVAVFAISTIAVYVVQDLPRHSFVRMMAYQAPYAVMQIVGLAIVWRAKPRRTLDTALMSLFGFSALQFVSKPFIAQAVGGWGANPQAYIDSNYALISQSLGTVFSIAVALLTLVIIVRDILADVTARSETDALSGLLNRGGFERHAEAAMRDAARRGLPVALVISDLDHFKAINDTFGHAAGDRVIEAFAGFLRSATNGHQIAGRIGGEEFAIALPGANLSGARLFAEGARSAFAALPIDGLPDDRRFTASFGVAELRIGESISDLMRRADEALYEAKKGGRDCVRVFVAQERRLSNVAG
jgi:diguanylate cyclase (GGDEF)-like protein